MSVFEYLIALVSAVVGLPIARTLGGILRIEHHRKSVIVDWLSLTWTATLLLWTVFFWWFTFGLADEATTWRMRNLLFVLGYAGAIYCVLGILYPDDIGHGFDMRGHFERNNRWFFGSLIVLATFDVFDTIYKIVNALALPPRQQQLLVRELTSMCCRASAGTAGLGAGTHCIRRRE